MRFDIDAYREILNTITRNKSRSILTGFGVFWGVFMLVALIGGSNGLKELLQKNFDGFATNSAMIMARSTTKAYKGFLEGRYWEMNTNDIKRLRQHVPELDVISSLLFAYGKVVVYGDRNSSGSIFGVDPSYMKVNEPKMYYGRFINEMDVAKERKVCVIGKRTYKNLFPEGDDPCGKSIRIDSAFYKIVGVDYRSSGMNVGGNSETSITLPITTVRKMYNRGDAIDLIAVTAKKDIRMSSITDRIRTVIAHEHFIDPTDEQGISILNTEAIFTIINNLFKGVNLLVWLVGAGTLLAGAIGVSNIMMVTVKERTTEIGIRRAIGATPKMVLSQVLSESVVLTAVAGMTGILFAVIVLQIVELVNTTDGVLKAHFQVNFWTAILAATLLCMLGGLAGLAPAWRAMSIKPVDAIRDE